MFIHSDKVATTRQQGSILVQQMETITDNHNWIQFRAQQSTRNLGLMLTSASRLQNLWFRDHHRIDARKMLRAAVAGILLLNSFSRNDYITKSITKAMSRAILMWKGKNIGWSKKYKQLSTAERRNDSLFQM